MTCEMCKFFKPEAAKPTQGECRRFPPTPVLGPHPVTRQPVPVGITAYVPKDYECGEFKLKVSVASS